MNRTLRFTQTREENLCNAVPRSREGDLWFSLPVYFVYVIDIVIPVTYPP